MVLEELKTKYEEVLKKWDNLKEILKPEKLEEEIKDLDNKMADPNFWNEPKKAQEISSKRNYLGEKLQLYQKGITDIDISEQEELQSALNLLKKSFKRKNIRKCGKISKKSWI